MQEIDEHERIRQLTSCMAPVKQVSVQKAIMLTNVANYCTFRRYSMKCMLPQ